MTRKRITFALAAASLLLIAGCAGGGGSSTGESEKADDVAILNDALGQERAAAETYARGAGQLHGEEKALAAQLLTQAQEHADAVTKAIRGLGGEPETGQAAEEPPTPDAQADFPSLAYEEENALLAFYVRSIPRLFTAAPRTLFASVAASDGEHLAELRETMGASAEELAPQAFETGDSPPPAPRRRAEN